MVEKVAMGSFGNTKRYLINPRPTLKMSASLQNKYNQRQKSKKGSLFMQKGFPKGLLLEIGLYLATDRFKIALKYMRTCKTIYKQCNENPLSWYFLYVHRYPQDFLNEYYKDIIGETKGQPTISDKKKHATVQYIDKNEVMT